MTTVTITFEEHTKLIDALIELLKVIPGIKVTITED